MIPCGFGQETGVSDENAPADVAKCIKGLGSGYAVNSKINPFYLRGDFRGDGKLSHVVLIQKDGKQGIIYCRSGVPTVLGAGMEFHNMTNLNFTSWQVHPKAVRVQRGVGEGMPPKLLGDAIVLEWDESASAFVYWNGRHFVWYQQGD